jgi:hypothetical protein
MEREQAKEKAVMGKVELEKAGLPLKPTGYWDVYLYCSLGLRSDGVSGSLLGSGLD